MKKENIYDIHFLISWRGWYVKTNHTDKWLLLPGENIYLKSILYAVESDKKIIY